MAKNNMDILLGNILGKAAIHPQDRFDKSVLTIKQLNRYLKPSQSQNRKNGHSR